MKADMGARIREARRSAGLKQEELARRVGIGKSSISEWESGKRSPDVAQLERLARALGISASALTGWSPSEAGAQLPSSVRRLADLPTRRVPMIGAVAAGVPIIAEQEYDVYADTPLRADFALTIEGDSMVPTYLDGDVIYIREQPDVPDGQVAVVLIDDTATLKHVYHMEYGLNLVSENPKYAPMIIRFDQHEHLRILGTVVGYTRMYAAADKLRGVTRGMPPAREGGAPRNQ